MASIVGEHDGALKVRLAAPPVDGEANRELVKLLARRLGVSQSAVRVVAGESGRNKLVEVAGVPVAGIRSALGISMPRVLFIFLDGVGLGDDDVRHNPFCPLTFPSFGNCSVVRFRCWRVPGSAARSIPARARRHAGVAGLPQSGTGQTSLLTGVNAPEIFGSHSGPFVPVRLRKVVATQSFLALARNAGHSVAFANAYPEELLRLVTADSDVERLPGPLRAGPPLAAFGAGLLMRATPETVRRRRCNGDHERRLDRALAPYRTARGISGNGGRKPGADCRRATT